MRSLPSIQSGYRFLTRPMVTILVSVAIGCAAGSPSTFSSLSEQGVLAVSTENPFVGANIFLSNEMEESRYLYNFMKEKGAPQAIELTGREISESELKMYYSSRQEMYTAVPEFDRSLGKKEWIVRGPYALDRASYRQVISLPSGQGGVFQVFGRREVLGGEMRAAETRVIPPVYIEPPQPKPVKRKVKPKATPPQKVAVEDDPLKNPSNLDQQALAEARQGKKTPSAEGKQPSVSVTVGDGRSPAKTTTPAPLPPAKPTVMSSTPPAKDQHEPHK